MAAHQQMPGSVSFLLAIGLVSLLVVWVAKHSRPKNDRKSDAKGDERPRKNDRKSEKGKRVAVVVLGDVGRSPRMQYHALSIAQLGMAVDLIGYQDSPLVSDLQAHENVRVLPLSPFPSALQKRIPVSLVALPLKALWQSWSLLWTLMTMDRPDWFLVQNPPSIPTFHIVWMASRLRGSRVLVDWHNYGFSIMALTKSPGHALTRLYRWYECFVGRHLGHAHLCVTHAMARQLARPPFGIDKTRITAFHDRPARLFQPILDAEARLARLAGIACTAPMVSRLRDGSLRLVVSSTSWTPDEDFGLFLDALQLYSRRRKRADDGHQATCGTATTDPGPCVLPDLYVVITGKGPQKAMYEETIRRRRQRGDLAGVTIETAWLTTDDYAALLACADVGVCLHTSSSGVDLPMKVVDMFGAGLPVLAYNDYASLAELVRDGVNGRGFHDAPGLAHGLCDAFSSALSDADTASPPTKLTLLEMWKEGAVAEGAIRWEDQWEDTVGAILQS